MSLDSPEASGQGPATACKYNKTASSPARPSPSALARSLPSSYTLASQFLDDPDPEFQIVDVKSDNEFIMGIEEENPMTFHCRDNRQERSLPLAYPKEIQLKIWRAREAAIDQAPTTDRTQRSKMSGKKVKRLDRLTPIEQVLKELSSKTLPTDESRSAILPRDESESTRETKTNLDAVEVGIGTFSEGVMQNFPCRVMKLSKSFERMMEKDGFDGIILLDEETSAIELLFAWFARNFDFEITIGTDPVRTHPF